MLQSGSPITITVPSTLAQSYTSGNLYPNSTGAPLQTPHTIQQWFNPAYNTATSTVPGAAFAAPTNGTFGNLQRNSVVGPGQILFDLSVGKTFDLWAERYKLQIRMDAFNALNHANFGNPGISLSTGSAGGHLEHNQQRKATPTRRTILLLILSGGVDDGLIVFIHSPSF